MAINFPLPKQLTMNLMMPIKQGVNIEEIRNVLMSDATKHVEILNNLGSIHFVRIVPIDNNTMLAMLTVFDGTLAEHIVEIAENVGGLFDSLASCIADAPATPVSDNIEAFKDWVNKYNVPPIMFYSATPKHGVEALKTLA